MPLETAAQERGPPRAQTTSRDAWIREGVAPPDTTRSSSVAIYERAGVREFWLIHPTDRVLMIYRLGVDGYGKPDVQELVGGTQVGVLEGVEILWDALVARLPPIEY